MSDTDEVKDPIWSALLGNPETREDALRLYKKAHPTEPVPEVDLVDRVRASNANERKADKEAIDALNMKVTELTQGLSLEKMRSKIVRDGYCTEDEIPEVEKLIKDEGFPNYLAAAKYFKAMRDSVPPSPEEYLKPADMGISEEFFKDADRAADVEAHRLVDQYMRDNTRATRH